jgi:hypothetical protein
MSVLTALGRLFGKTSLFVYGCYWLLVLLVLGTIAQRDMGLYLAQKKYFSSWIILLGDVVPVPGGRLTMLVVFLGLITSFARDFSLKVRKIGIQILHFGSIMLLVGGFLTAYTSSEGSVVIPEGESSSFVSDYHDRELAIVDTRPSDRDRVTAISHHVLKPGKSFDLEDFPGRIEVLEVHRNCQPVRRTQPAPAGARGLYENFELEPLPRSKEEEQNVLGAVLRLVGAGDAADGVYALFEHQSVPQTVSTSDGERTLILRRQRTYLPFAIELIDFEKKLHPGTGMARSYRSIVNLVEHDTKRRVVIQMNEPLRHEGYTFYQASFIEGRGSDTTVLAAVKNAGRTLPYISSLVMCLGLLVHLVLKVPTLIRSRGGAA